MKSYFYSVLAIICCAVPAAVVSSWGWKAVGLQGVGLAVATVITAMVLATALFALFSLLGKALKITK